MPATRQQKVKKEAVKLDESHDQTGLVSDLLGLVVDFVSDAQKNKTWTGDQKLSWVLEKLRDAGVDHSLTDHVVMVVGIVVDVAKNEEVRRVFSKTARFLCC